MRHRAEAARPLVLAAALCASPSGLFIIEKWSPLGCISSNWPPLPVSGKKLRRCQLIRLACARLGLEKTNSFLLPCYATLAIHHKSNFQINCFGGARSQPYLRKLDSVSNEIKRALELQLPVGSPIQEISSFVPASGARRGRTGADLHSKSLGAARRDQARTTPNDNSIATSETSFRVRLPNGAELIGFRPAGWRLRVRPSFCRKADHSIGRRITRPDTGLSRIMSPEPGRLAPGRP